MGVHVLAVCCTIAYVMLGPATGSPWSAHAPITPLCVLLQSNAHMYMYMSNACQIHVKCAHVHRQVLLERAGVCCQY
jgi:hypothetical protein